MELFRPRGLPIELIGHSEAVVSLAFSPSGNQLLSAGDGDGTIRLWQFGGTFRELTELKKLGPFRGSIFDVTFGQDDWRFASGSGNQPGDPDPDNTVRIWNYNISEKAVKLSGNESPITSVVFNSGGNLIACSGEDYKEIMVWDIANLASPKEVISTGQSSVTSLAFRPNSDAIAWGSSDGSLRLLELNTHKTINFLHKQKAITTIAFDPKGVFIAAGIDDSSIVVWRVDSPENVISILRGHDGMINDIDINVDLILASASTDGTVRLWDLKEVKNYPRVLKGPWSAVFSISFSHDGYWLAVGSSNPVILLYPLTDELSKIVCQNVWRNLTNKEWQDVMGDGIEYECTCQNFNPGYDTKLDACPYVK